jgi:hypothetical protein
VSPAAADRARLQRALLVEQLIVARGLTGSHVARDALTQWQQWTAGRAVHREASTTGSEWVADADDDTKHRHVPTGTMVTSLPELFVARDRVCSEVGVRRSIVMDIAGLPGATIHTERPETISRDNVAASIRAAKIHIAEQHTKVATLQENLAGAKDEVAALAAAEEPRKLEVQRLGRDVADRDEQVTILTDEVTAGHEREQGLRYDVTEANAHAKHVQAEAEHWRQQLEQEQRGIPTDVEAQLQNKDELSVHLHQELAKVRTAYRNLKKQHTALEGELEQVRTATAAKSKRSGSNLSAIAGGYKSPYAAAASSPVSARSPLYRGVKALGGNMIPAAPTSAKEQVIIMGDDDADDHREQLMSSPRDEASPPRDASAPPAADDVDELDEDAFQPEGEGIDEDAVAAEEYATPSQGACPHCAVALTPYHGDRVGGGDKDKVAFCFSCRRAFSRRDLRNRDLRLSNKRFVESKFQ